MKFVKGNWKLGMCAGAILAAASIPALFAASPANQDEAALTQIAQEYEQAMNSYNIDAFLPRLADHIDAWMPLGIRVTTPEEFRSYMKAMADLIGIGKIDANGQPAGSYHINPIVTDRRIFADGDNVFSSGHMSESVRFQGEKKKNYASHWIVHLQRQGGSWKLVGGVLEVDHVVFPQAEIDKVRQKVELAMKSAAQKTTP